MKQLKNWLASAFLVMALGLSVMPWLPTSEVHARGEICDTFDDWDNTCHGHPTNCFCEIVVE